MLKKLIIFVVLMMVFFASSWSFFRSDFFLVHDFTHGARIVEMHKALVDGHFPVRWSSDLGYGYGMPLFEFYAPLPYYVGAFFYEIGFSLIDSIKLLFLISTLVVLIGSYKLGKSLFGSLGGLLVASAVTLAPYRAVNLFVRGAISELWGIMALPFILYGIIKVVGDDGKAVFGKKQSWLILLISLLVLLLSHNLTSLIFLPLSILFGGIYLILETQKQKTENKKQFFIKNFLILFGVYLLAVLMSSFYLLPAIMEKGFTRLEQAIVGNYFDYNLHFLYIKQFFEVNWKYGGSSWGPYDDVSFYLGTGQLLAFGISALLFAKRISKNISLKIGQIITANGLYLTTLFLLAFSALMTLNRSKLIWDSISIFSFIQFPWRWLSAVIVFLSIAIGFIVKFIKGKFHQYLFSGVLILIIIFSNYKFFQPEKFLEDTSDYYYSDIAKIRNKMSETLPDYIPAQVKTVEIIPVAQEDAVLGCEVAREYSGINIQILGDRNNYCEFEFTKITNKTHKKLVEVELPQKTMLEFAVLDFPGWTAEVDGVVVGKGVSNSGTILVPVEPGKHQVGLEFKDTKVRSISDRISVFGLVIFLSILFWYHKHND